jgi:hypothetical protein
VEVTYVQVHRLDRQVRDSLAQRPERLDGLQEGHEPADSGAGGVVVSGGDRPLSEFGIEGGRPLEPGETVASQNAMFALPGDMWVPGNVWSLERVFDAGPAAEMGVGPTPESRCCRPRAAVR